MIVNLTESESRSIKDELEKLRKFIELAGRLGWRTKSKYVVRRLCKLWWKYHEK